jgi:hypothetical protein
LKVSAVAGFLLVSLWGVGYTVELILPENGFVRPADLEAMQWIQENTPQDALFHISAYFWQPDVVHGLDAGFWIPFLAQRQTTIPAQVYDSDGSAGYAAFINRRARMLLGANTPEQLWQVMREYHVTHVYIGNRQTGLHPEFFLAAPTRFRVLYSKDNVWVFKVIE